MSERTLSANERRRQDSNLRNTLMLDGFQDRCLKPLGHASSAEAKGSGHLDWKQGFGGRARRAGANRQ